MRSGLIYRSIKLKCFPIWRRGGERPLTQNVGETPPRRAGWIFSLDFRRWIGQFIFISSSLKWRKTWKWQKIVSQIFDQILHFLVRKPVWIFVLEIYRRFFAPSFWNDFLLSALKYVVVLLFSLLIFMTSRVANLNIAKPRSIVRKVFF